MKLKSDRQCNHANGKHLSKIQWMPVIRTSSGIAYNVKRIKHVLITDTSYTMDIAHKDTLGEPKTCSL